MKGELLWEFRNEVAYMSNYISNLLNSLLLAGADFSKISKTGFNYSSETMHENARPTRSAYAQQVDAWFTNLQNSHGKYLPQGMKDLRTLNMSDDALEMLAFSVYNSVNAAVKPKEEEHFDIVQYKLPDGSYLWKDHISGKVLRATKVGHHYDFSGAHSLKFAIGGRGELGNVMKMLEDDDPNHDYPMRKAA
ncbi:MAG: hypothetical protein HY513_00535 [Candidatus Aenigmarchaeota archaeon]|nr:hypothetical protein [Candidatus Aenigmarchaeota archaeon]